VKNIISVILLNSKNSYLSRVGIAFLEVLIVIVYSSLKCKETHGKIATIVGNGVFKYRTGRI
jgi:hypothetical protein